MRFNTLGDAVYGAGAVCINGATPAALVGRVTGKGVWMDDATVVYQDGVTGGGPWTLGQITYPGGVVTVADADGANFTWGGGGIWAALLGSLGGTRTSDVDLGPWTGAGVGDISFDGLVVRIDDYQVGGPLTIFDDTGATVAEFSDVVTGWNFSIRLRDRFLGYPDASAKWHIIDIDTGEPAHWYPRLDGVVRLTPIIHESQLFVLEGNNDRLTLRAADRARGWNIIVGPTFFFPDGISLNSTTIRIGSCTNQGELADSLQVFDCVVNTNGTLTVTPYTVVLGVLTAGTDYVLNPVDDFPVGPLEGGNLTNTLRNPYIQPMLDKGGRTTEPWTKYFAAVDQTINNVGGVVQNMPSPNPGKGGFDQIDSDGQPSIVAENSSQALVINTDTPDALEIILNPGTNTVILNVLVTGGYVPVTTGAEPLVFVSDGAGHPLLTPYTP